MGTWLQLFLHDQDHNFMKHFVQIVFFPLTFFILHSANMEADDVQMERKGS